MTTVARVRVEWSGSAVEGTGLSTFYSVGPGSDLSDDVAAFFTSIRGAFPDDLTWVVPSSGDTLDDNTGQINGTWTGGIGAVIVGLNSENGYAQGVGARIRWETAGLTAGRHVRGSTFLCPLAGNSYATDGTIGDSTLTLLQGAADALLSAQAGNLVILTRLTPSHSGTSHEVTDALVPDKISWLRTRRT